MGRDIKTSRTGEPKKVDRLCKFVVQSYKNKEVLKAPEDESQKEFLLSHGIIFLKDNFEMVVVDIFFKTIQFSELGFVLNYELCKEYIQRYELDFIEIWEILSAMNACLNKESMKG